MYLLYRLCAYEVAEIIVRELGLKNTDTEVGPIKRTAPEYK